MRSRVAALVVLVLVGSVAVLAWWIPRRHADEKMAAASWPATLVHVSDGDTVDVEGPRGRVRVRLLGIDAPELAKDGKPAECGATASRDALRSRLGHRVVVVPDLVGDRTDRYARVLAYVEDGGMDLGRAQVSEGWAEAWYPASSVQPSRDKAYRAAQHTAQTSRTGAWASCPTLGR